MPIAGEETASHTVNTESQDHHTAVPLERTELPAEHVGTEQQSSPHHQPVHVPPTVNHDEQVERLLHALDAQHEMKEMLAQVGETLADAVSRMSASSPAAVSAEILDLLNKLRTENHEARASAHAAAANRGDTAQGGEEIGDKAGELVAAVTRLESHLATSKVSDVHGLLVSAAASQEQLGLAASQRMASLASELASVKHELESLRSLCKDGSDSAKREAAAIKAAVDDVRNTRPWTIFPLAVCAQALVLSAFFFYRSGDSGGRRHSHLP